MDYLQDYDGICKSFSISNDLFYYSVAPAQWTLWRGHTLNAQQSATNLAYNNNFLTTLSVALQSYLVILK